MLLHELEATAVKDLGQPLFGHVQFAERDDPPNAAFQVAEQVLVAQAEHVRVVAVSPPARDVVEPRTPDDPASHVTPEELIERASVAEVRFVEMIERDGHVLAVPGHVDIAALATRDPDVGQVAFEDPRRGHLVQIPLVERRPLEPGTNVGNMAEVHAPVGRQLVHDHLHPGRTRPGIGIDKHIVGPGRIVEVEQPGVVDGHVDAHQRHGKPLQELAQDPEVGRNQPADRTEKSPDACHDA